ncbi:alpha/beta hydrolase [Rhizobium sp. TRM95111]|uniref:serine aminopeptidase domain-containing protein n=1 Tax=Rhizobium alarense TaxID=2846851 RepID=UPI001F2B77F9|nr:alpha/beta hydrolase [Rhizobium alarense]MCF3642708.1 alpha/beta hydrolase [Rhizobium alarense]
MRVAEDAIAPQAARRDVRAVARPVTFTGLPGFFQPAGPDARDLAVLLVPPFGMEEMCSRRFFRHLAERLAAAGFASLRFDLPGTGNAVDASDDPITLASWTAAVVEATAVLRHLSGVRDVVLVGQGIGGALVLSALSSIDGVAGIGLLAPVLKGRAHLRELSLWSRVIDEGLGLEDALRDTRPGAIAGLSMPEGVAADLKRLDLTQAPVPAVPILLVHRPAGQAELDFAGHLRGRTADLHVLPFDGYDEYVLNPLGQRLPMAVGDALTDWLAPLPGAARPPAPAPSSPLDTRPLAAAGFRETPMRFGPADALAGTLCEPTDKSNAVTVVILSTGYDHQAGWARGSVELARRLARSGVTSLRFDGAGVGDSPPLPDRPRQILYHDSQQADVAAAGALLDRLGRTGPAVLFGRCSGAYLAFRTALADPRWAGVVAVNPYTLRFREPPSEETILRVPRSFRHYSEKAFKAETFQRLLAGEIDLRNAMRNVVLRAGQRLAGRLAPLLGPLLPSERWSRLVRADVRQLDARGARLCLVYSDGDEGLETFRQQFGANGERLAGSPHVEMHVVADADHNMTPSASRKVLHTIVERFALELQPTSCGSGAKDV